MAMVTLTYFFAEGRGEFPLEMLPYDNAWPVTKAELDKITPRYLNGEDRELLARRKVHMCCAKWAPTEGRWESFGWKISY